MDNNGSGNGTLVIVPALAAQNAPGADPLTDIAGLPMVVHVWRRAMEAELGPVLIASPDPNVIKTVEGCGARALRAGASTDGATQLVAAAAQEVDPERGLDAVVSVPCDRPLIKPRTVQRCLEPLAEPVVDIGTLAAPIVDGNDDLNPGVIKAALVLTAGRTIARVTDFARLTPPGTGGTRFRHIELYAWRRTVIENFVLLPASVREKQIQLEQVRAIDAGMRVDAALVDTAPRRVDTPADLAHVRAELEPKSSIP